jgi:hypothetical protein
MGLEASCGSDEIRKRFRELARKYHPDLHSDHPEYHEVFVRISQAYDVLSDSTRRARYDLDLRDKARRDAARASQSYGSAPTGQNGAHANGPRPNGARPNAAAQRPPAGSRARREADQRRVAVVRMMDDARNAYSRGHLGEALRLCNEVLAIQKVGAAHELMGDIYQRQGRLEEAVSAYTIAAQMVPQNGLVMAKLNRVAARIRTADRDYDLPRSGRPQRSNLAGYKMAVASFGFALVVFLIIWGSSLVQNGRFEPFIGGWSLTHVGLFAGAGFASGLILAAGAWIRPIDQELFYTSLGTRRRSLPLGLMLTVAGALFFPLAIGAYVIFARLQEAVSSSILAVLGVTALVTLGFVFAAERTLMQTLLFGGNFVWLSLLLGWFVGDLFRPNWAL